MVSNITKWALVNGEMASPSAGPPPFGDVIGCKVMVGSAIMAGGVWGSADFDEQTRIATAAKFTDKSVRVRHFTNKNGLKGIQETQTIKASDQNSVFTVPAKGKAGSPRDVEKELGIKRGRGNHYVEFEAGYGEFEVIKNGLTKAIEYVFKGNVNLSGRNPTFHER